MTTTPRRLLVSHPDQKAELQAAIMGAGLAATVSVVSDSLVPLGIAYVVDPDWVNNNLNHWPW